MTEHLINRPAQVTACSRCGQKTLTAITGGLTTTIDPGSLTIAQEIAARITGKATFDLVPFGTALYFEWRDITRVKAPRVYAVAAIHQCRGARQVALPLAPAAQVPDDPPF